MIDVTLYHNPRCSKSRQALALLQGKGVHLTQVPYLKTPPDAAAFRNLIRQLGLNSAHDLLRTKEAEYKQARLGPESSEEDIIEALVAYPKLMERPIAVVGDKAVIGRPPEKVLDLI